MRATNPSLSLVRIQPPLPYKYDMANKEQPAQADKEEQNPQVELYKKQISDDVRNKNKY